MLHVNHQTTKKGAVTLTVYREWDYNSMRVTEYKRSGECKACGACCRAHVSFSHTTPPRAGDPYKGGSTTYGKGVWQEVDMGRWSYFYEITVDSEEKVCGCLSDKNLCNYHEDPDRSMICRVWPIGPTCIAQFPLCGWSFECIGQWEFAQNRHSPCPSPS